MNGLESSMAPLPAEMIKACPYTGHKFREAIPKEAWDLYCFATRRDTGLPRLEHLRAAHHVYWPWFEWNPWNEWAFDALCRNNLVSMTGCGGSGKSMSAIAFAFAWWMPFSKSSRVVLTSTSVKAIRSRQWAEVQKFWHTASSVLSAVGFNMVNSEMRLESTKGDARNAIIATAVEEGELGKSMAKIQGIHTKRMMIIIDEATDTPDAIFRVTENLRIGCEEFVMIVIGNASSQLDPHGQYCEPKDGWLSISCEDEEWETKKGGICLHFDGDKSPNITSGGKNWPGIITLANVLRSRKDDGEDTPEYWKYIKGFWAPEGILKTVFSPMMAEKYNVRGRLVFLTESRPCASLDPAFEGGDRRVLKLGKLGEIGAGKIGVQFEETRLLKISVKDPQPIHYQIAHQVIDILKEKNVRPQDFAMDTTGEGGGLADIIGTLWSNNFVRVEFGGKASDLPVSPQDNRPAKEAYKNRVAELWFSVREFARHGQIGGLDADAILELCQRKYKEKRGIFELETKEEMKQRTRKSPDHADATAVMVALCRSLGGAAGGAAGTAETDRDWLNQAININSVYEEEAA